MCTWRRREGPLLYHIAVRCCSVGANTTHKVDTDGDGVVDAAFRAVEAVAPTVSELLLYSVNNITSGTDAQGEVSVRLQQNDRVVNGQGSDTDIVAASVKAYINALNKLQDNTSRQFSQVGDTP